MDHYQELWAAVQQVAPASTLEGPQLNVLLSGFRGKLLGLYHNTGPNPELRRQVQRGRLTTPSYGDVPLDYDPDQLQVLELSERLRLDETTCVELLCAAADKGTPGFQAAFGTYLSERLAGARALCRLLTLQLFHQLEQRPDAGSEGIEGMMGGGADGLHASLADSVDPLLGVVLKFNAGLLAAEGGGRNTLVSQLVAVIQDHTLDRLGSAYDHGIDEHGAVIHRSQYLALERAELCRALLYAVVLSQEPLKPATLAELLQLLDALVARVKAAGGGAQHMLQQQACNTLLAVVAALSLENAVGGPATRPGAMLQLLKAQELQAALEKVAKPEDGFGAVVALAWGLSKDAVISRTGPEAGGGAAHDGSLVGPPSTALLEAAGKGRALGTLSALLSSVAFQLEAEQEHRHLCARIVFGLLTETLKFDAANRRDLTESLVKTSKQHQKDQTSSSRGGTWFPHAASAAELLALSTPQAGGAAAGSAPAGALGMFGATVAAGTPAGVLPPQLAGLALQDDLSSLLEAVAAVFAVRPGLWHAREAPEAYPFVSGFMSHVAVSPAVQLPDVRVSFLSVMTSLASGPQGSRFILLQFRQNASKAELEGFTWRKLFRSIVEYCQRYEELERTSAAAAAGGMMLGPGVLAARDRALMAPGDAVLLVAYLELLTKVISAGTLDEVRASLQGLERDVAGVLGGLPLYEPLFQLMCHGVPPRVKAATHRCLAAMGRFKELASRLLERLVQAAIVSTPVTGLEGYAGLSRFDLLLQINEVEARQEDYAETLAFLHLVNSLLATLGPTGLPAGGIAVSHYTSFVLQHVVGQLWQRGYREPAQKWQLAAACFRHCQLVLAALASCSPTMSMQELMARPPPGLLVLLELMGGKGLEKALLQHVLGPGYESLEASLQVGSEGPDRAVAVLQGYKLLNLALEYDQAAAEQFNSWTAVERVRERVSPLHHQLLSPPHRIAVLLLYVMHQDMDLQLEVIRLLGQLAARLPDLVGLLQPNFDESAAVLIRQGFAQSFELALLDPSAGETVSAGMASAREAEDGAQQPMQDGDAAAAGGGSQAPMARCDQRAELLLDVMLGTLDAGPPPTLGHLLLGFDTVASPDEWPNMALNPALDLSCMSVLIKALQADVLQHLKPSLYAKCLQLLDAVAESPYTCGPVLQLLHPREGPADGLLPALGRLLQEGLPADAAGVHDQVAALRQRAFVLRMYALILLRCEQASMLEPVLAALLGASGGATAAGADNGFSNGGGAAAALLGPHHGASGSAALVALQHICGVALPEARSEIPPELQALQQDMVVDDVSVAALLTQPAAMDACGVVTRDDYGQSVFNFQVLQRLLHERYEDYVAKSGGRGTPAEKAAREAIVAAFTHAQRFNAHALLAGAQSLAISGWVQAVNVAFTKCYSLINAATAPGCGPDLLHRHLLGMLQQVRELPGRQQTDLAEKLAMCCRVLLSKLQELASSSLSLGLPGDPLSQVRLPVRCAALLQHLLECLRGASSHRGLRAESHKALRGELYVCLLQYIHFCRGIKLADCPPLVLSCLLAGAGPGTSAAQLDALQQQLEEVNGRLLREHAGELVALIMGDVLQPPEQGRMGQAVALHLLAALVAADPGSTQVAAALHREKVPRALLQSVTAYAPTVLLQPANKSQAALLVLEAQLSVLLALTAAGGPLSQKASTKQVADAEALPHLTNCEALDYTPEQPSSHQRLKKSGSLRYRLVKLVCPVLRLVLALLGGSPGSSKLVQQATAFCTTHQDLLARLLQEAAAPATAAWAPGDEELEQAALAVSLLARLPGALLPPSATSMGAGGPAPAAGSLSGLRRDLWRLWLVLAGQDRDSGERGVSSYIRAAATMDPSTTTGTARAQLERRRSLLLQLRCGLASCLRDAVTPCAAAGGKPSAATAGSGVGRGVFSGVGPGGSELLVCWGHDAQKTVDAMGRPTLLLVHDTARQAVADTRQLAGHLEELLRFLATPDGQLGSEDVGQKLAEWGPNLAALAGRHGHGHGHEAAAAAGGGDDADDSMAIVLASAGADGADGDAPAAAAPYGGLEPAAARRLARQCCTRASGGLLAQLSRQLYLLEQCLTIVLLHFVQCLPRPDAAAAMAVDAAQAGGGYGAAAGGDELVPSPGPEAAAALGDPGKLQFFANRMRELCQAAGSMAAAVRGVLVGSGGGDGGDGLGGGADFGGSGGGMGMAGGDDGGLMGGAGAAVGARPLLDSLDSIDLLNRQLCSYLAADM